MPQITSLSGVKAFHLSVSYDEKNDRLLFDRILKEGTGEEIYGITVAKYIIQDSEFTELTNKIKDELLGTKNKIVQTKISKYNSGVYVDHCAVCHCELKEKDNIINLDTHHIHQQKDCHDNLVDNKKYIHKNDKSNLVVLCKKCHRKYHDGEIDIEKYINSTSGKILKYQ